MSCEEARKLMHGFADRELGLESSLRLEAHLEGCGACRALLADLEASRRSAAAAMAYHASPISIPTPAAPNPQCQPISSPRKPVMICPKNAPVLIPM